MWATAVTQVSSNPIEHQLWAQHGYDRGLQEPKQRTFWNAQNIPTLHPLSFY